MSAPLQQSEQDIRLLVHEIRNPLTAIDAANQMLSELLHSDQPLNSSDLKMISAVISRNTTRIEKLLHQSFHAEECPAFHEEQRDICPIIDNALDQVRDRLLMAHISVKRQYKSGFPIRCQEERLLLAFSNIIANAVEAAEDGGSLSIEVFPDGNNLLVRFHDTGCGIPDVAQGQLFQRNYTTKPRGLGVGLTLVKDIIDAHEASIQIRSNPGEGTTVILRFPLAGHSCSG